MSTPILLPSTTEAVDKVSCGLCRRQFAKYTCPTCNVPYCSLICFRFEAHSQCSETFYKKEVESDIRTEPSKTPQERLRMLELLKKFEEENNNPEQLTVDGDDEDEDDEDDTEGAAADLAQRFQSVDINVSSSETLWSILTEEEQKKFMKVLDDPNSELAQQILASEELEKEIQPPWWETFSVEDDETDPFPSRSTRQRGRKPDMIRIPTSIIEAAPKGSLVYNTCAICIAYAYSIRHLGISMLSILHPDNPDYHEGRKLVSKLVPFITDRRSAVLFPNLTSVVTDIWSRFDLGKMTSGLFALLLSDAAQLMRTLPVVPLPPQVNGLTGVAEPGKSDLDLSLNPHTLSVLVLSDLSHLFGTLSLEREWRKPNHVTHKMLFYAAHILSTPTAILNAVATEAELRAKSFQNDEEK